MSPKMSATEFNEGVKRMGWTTDEEIAVRLGISMRSVYNYRKNGCPRKGASKQMRRQMKGGKAA